MRDITGAPPWPSRHTEVQAQSVWWPGITQHIKDLIKSCHFCAQMSIPHPEPLIPTPLPEYPCKMVASEMFVLNSDSYLIIVDYFSRYPEVLKSTTSSAITVAKEGNLECSGQQRWFLHLPQGGYGRGAPLPPS